jgi:hypothetical protein
MPQPGQPQLPPILEFQRNIWWDPAPDWLIRELDQATLLRLGAIELQYRIAVLETSVNALKQVQEVIQGKIK